MNTSRIRLNLKKGRTPSVSLLKPGQEIEAGDIVVMDSWVESPSETNVGKQCAEKEVILRLAFQE